METFIETDRFLMREIVEEDLPGFFEMDSNPEVHRYLGNNPVTTIDQSKAMIEGVRQQYKKFGIGRWAVIWKATGEFTGWSGLKYEQHLRSDRAYYDLGYRFLPQFWGRGLATETATAALQYGFREMNLSQICGAADVAHSVSNHILQKVGLRYVEQFTYENDLCNWYELSKIDWESSRAEK